MSGRRRRLLWHGMFLFLLGLFTGLAETQFTNPRMGLAAHLEGIMNGLLLMVVGAIWSEVHLSPRRQDGAYWLLLYGTYANWAVTTLAAVFGTSSQTPIAGSGYEAQTWQEGLVTAGFVSVGPSSMSFRN